MKGTVLKSIQTPATSVEMPTLFVEASNGIFKIEMWPNQNPKVMVSSRREVEARQGEPDYFKGCNGTSVQVSESGFCWL